MAIYNKAYETEVYADEGCVWIVQRDESGSEDLVQLNQDQASWLLAELEVAIREAE